MTKQAWRSLTDALRSEGVQLSGRELAQVVRLATKVEGWYEETIKGLWTVMRVTNSSRLLC